MMFHEMLANKILMLLLNPGLLIILFSIVSYPVKKHKPLIFMLIAIVAIVLLTLHYCNILGGEEIKVFKYGFLDFKTTNLSFVTSVVFLIAFLSLTAFYIEQTSFKYLLNFGGVITGGSIIAVNAQEYLTLFLGLELISIASFFMIFTEDNKNTFGLGFRYLLIHLFSSILLFVGVMYFGDKGFEIKHLDLVDLFKQDSWRTMSLEQIASVLILFAFLINCAVPPFSNWLVDTYSNISPISASFLSSYGTKVSVFMILKIFLANQVLVYIGLATMTYSLLLSFATGSIRRILSLLLVYQLGLMITVIGFGGEIVNVAVVSSLFVHVLYNLIFFFIASKLSLSYGVNSINEILILDKNVRLFSFIGVMIAIGVPFSGVYVAKSLLLNALGNGYFYLASIFMLAPFIVSICRLIMPYFLKHGLILGGENEWKRIELLVVYSLVIILVLALYLPDLLFSRATNIVNDIFAFSYLFKNLLVILVATLQCYFLRRFLVYNDNEVLDFDWFFRKLMYKLRFSASSLSGESDRLALKHIRSMLEESLSRYCEYFVYRVWSVSSVINILVVTLIILFLITYI